MTQTNRTNDDSLSKALDSVEGLWTVVCTSGEYHDSYTHSSTVGLFASEDLADAYMDLYAEASQKAEQDEYNTNTYSRWSKKFVPAAPKQMPDIALYYIVETSRDEDTGKRDVEKVEVVLVNLNNEPSSEVERFARENKDKAFQLVSPHGVTPQVILGSDEFPAMVYDKKYKSYDGGYETFVSFTKNAVILDPPVGYVHPKPIPFEESFTPFVDAAISGYTKEEISQMAEWELDLLGLEPVVLDVAPEVTE